MVNTYAKIKVVFLKWSFFEVAVVCVQKQGVPVLRKDHTLAFCFHTRRLHELIHLTEQPIGELSFSDCLRCRFNMLSWLNGCQ